jgi:hypothetical protein
MGVGGSLRGKSYNKPKELLKDIIANMEKYENIADNNFKTMFD